jgi:ABC-type uncharacterized transport system fused permease/ATPase subunit
MVQTALNWLVDNYPGLAECLSSVNRVGSLLLALDEIDRDGECRNDDIVIDGSSRPPRGSCLEDLASTTTTLSGRTPPL